jgi:uncharacterized Zn-finger protein
MSSQPLNDQPTFLLWSSEAIGWENTEPFVSWSLPLDSLNTNPIISSFTASEPTDMISQFSAATLNASVQSPSPTSNVDVGTYSCTYTGCTQRFALIHKLRRHMLTHKRQNMESQTGSYRCDRDNPNTGKPCSRTFSRPYDLTRHEDSIHNLNKLEIKCVICKEEKLFSRRDALSKHVRTVHSKREKRRGLCGN